MYAAQRAYIKEEEQTAQRFNNKECKIDTVDEKTWGACSCIDCNTGNDIQPCLSKSSNKKIEEKAQRTRSNLALRPNMEQKSKHDNKRSQLVFIDVVHVKFTAPRR